MSKALVMTDRSSNKSGLHRILVVDDNAMSRKMLEHRFVQEGHDVSSVETGDEALADVANNQPDIIFLDLHLAGMSGLDVLKTLKGDAKTEAIPVVIVSGIDRADAITECHEAGAAEFLHKPASREALREITADLLGVEDAAIVSNGAVQLESASDISVEDAKVFDPARLEVLRKDYGADKADDFARRFFETSKALCRKAVNSAEQGQAEAWKFAIHDLKGSARTLGLSRLAAACRQVERTLENGAGTEAAELTAKLPNHLDIALDALRQQNT